MIVGLIGCYLVDCKKYVVVSSENGWYVCIYWILVECFGDYFLLCFKFDIGWIYQICVYCVYMNYFVVGDFIYSCCCKLLIELFGQVLYVVQLGLDYLIICEWMVFEVFFFLVMEKLLGVLR